MDGNNKQIPGGAEELGQCKEIEVEEMIKQLGISARGCNKCTNN